jgi:hypothetical protein
MDRCHCLHRLYFDNQLILDQQINAISNIRQLLAVIHNWHRHFRQSTDATLRKLISEACLICALQQPRTKLATNCESRIQSSLG